MIENLPHKNYNATIGEITMYATLDNVDSIFLKY